jgi:hypothetical protein
LYSFRDLRKTQEQELDYFGRQVREFEGTYLARIEELKEDLRNLHAKYDALGLANLGKPKEGKETEVGEDSPMKGVHVVSIRGGGFNLGDILGHILGNTVPPEIKATKLLFDVVQNDKKTAAKLVEAMKNVTDNEVLNVALQGLIEREDYEYVQLVRNEIEKRKTQKTRK